MRIKDLSFLIEQVKNGFTSVKMGLFNMPNNPSILEPQ